VRKLIVVSLFSGAGGLDLGFLNSGFFQIIYANDVLLPAMQTYSANFGLKLAKCGDDRFIAEPNTALVCNVENVDFSQLSGTDIVVGGLLNS
jgi:DNA (cytosine-5)-methyltransferase 1